MPSRAKEIFVLAGPNGAGKTTFAREFLPAEAGAPPFLNADLIAAELSPADPELAAMRAGRLMLKRMAEHVERGDSFAFETTLSDRGFSRSIETWQREGYYITLWFLALPNVEMALNRVAQRVQHGGHKIPGRRRPSPVHRRSSELWDDLSWNRRCVAALRQFRPHSPSARLGREAMNPKPIEQAKNPLLARSMAAMLRARKRAEEIAIATDTALVEMVDGKVVLVYPGRKTEAASR
jgi:predicted ABC-type ATPase